MTNVNKNQKQNIFQRSLLENKFLLEDNLAKNNLNNRLKPHPIGKIRSSVLKKPAIIESTVSFM